MAWYAYCIAEKQAFPELLRHRKPIPMETVSGIAGNQVFLYPASDLAVIVSEHSTEDNLNDRAAVEHARVIADCFKSSTVLPFRFGTVFQDDESLRKSIRSNQRQFQGNLERLHGKTEMHLKIHVDACCTKEFEKHLPLEGVGKEYLSNLRENATRQRERQTRARAVSFQMHRMFSPLDEEVSCRMTESGKMLLDSKRLWGSSRKFCTNSPFPSGSSRWSGRWSGKSDTPGTGFEGAIDMEQPPYWRRPGELSFCQHSTRITPRRQCVRAMSTHRCRARFDGRACRVPPGLVRPR